MASFQLEGLDSACLGAERGRPPQARADGLDQERLTPGWGPGPRPGGQEASPRRGAGAGGGALAALSSSRATLSPAPPSHPELLQNPVRPESPGDDGPGWAAGRGWLGAWGSARGGPGRTWRCVARPPSFFKEPLCFREFWVHNEIEWKSQRVPIGPCRPDSPTFNSPPRQSGTFATVNEPRGTSLSLRVSVRLRAQLTLAVVRSVGLDKGAVPCVHPDSVMYRSSSHKHLGAPPVPPSLPPC